MSEPVAFRRLFVDHGTVCVETAPGEVFYLPNGTDGRPRYDPSVVFLRVKTAGRVDLERWARWG